jgi:hypothetical protein
MTAARDGCCTAPRRYIAYEDIPTFATDDAIRVGRLHCARDGWEDDQMQWLLGGGYSVSSLVRSIADAEVPCLVLWGRQDRVLPPAEYVPKFVDALPACTFRWVEECGHVPHLEQPAVTAAAIAAFARGGDVAGDGDSRVASPPSPLEQLNALLDRPILDTNVRGGALEPLKKLIRSEPELAQVLASVLALSFFGAVGVAFGRLVAGL